MAVSPHLNNERIRSEIRQLLGDSPGPRHYDEIATGLNRTPLGTANSEILTLLRAMAKDGEVLEVKSYYFDLPPS